MPVTSQDLAQFAVGCPVGSAEMEAAEPAIIDTLAAMVAGSIEPVVSRLLTVTGPIGDASGFPAIGHDARFRADDAALLYGTAAHALDYDDVSMLAICHPSAPVLSALLACAPWESVQGPDLCEAHVIGTETMIRMGQAIGLRHYEIGYHSTATLGLFGAVAAIARLNGLDRETAHTSFAIAASMASGMRVNFGTDVKPLHVGLAASNAIDACRWAAAGLTASTGNLFAAGGILATLSGRTAWEWADSVALGDPFAIVHPGFEQKRFPGCYLLHKVMALGIEIAQADIALDQIRSIEVTMPRGGTRPLIHPRPSTGREAQFSVPYGLLAAIADKAVTFTTFTDEAVGRSAIRHRFDHVIVTEDGPDLATSEEIAAAPVRVNLEMLDGASRMFQRDATPGSALDPMTATQRRTKWVDCLRRANPSMTPQDAGHAYDSARAGLRSGVLSSWMPDLWRSATPQPNREFACS